MFLFSFASSFSYFYQAYKNSYTETPVTVIDKETQERVVLTKGSPVYNQVINLLGGETKVELKPFFNRVGVKKDIIIVERLGGALCGISGVNFRSKGDIAIFLAPNLRATDKEAADYSIKHATACAVNNDQFRGPMLAGLYSAAAASLTAFKRVSPIRGVVIAAGVGAIVEGVFSLSSAKKADDFAIAESSVEELQGGKRLFLAFQQANILRRNTFIQQIVYSPKGDMRIDFFYPSLSSRIKKIEQALVEKGVQPKSENIENWEEEAKKLKTLQQYIADWQQALADFKSPKTS